MKKLLLILLLLTLTSCELTFQHSNLEEQCNAQNKEIQLRIDFIKNSAEKLTKDSLKKMAKLELLKCKL